MVKVITYGTYDLLHFGHIRLLERAKALGDYLIVGITSDDYDKTRGKINNQQSLMERIAAVEATGLADEIIIEEYEGQKIDDIRRYGINIFTVGSDWEGKFDYLSTYCKVIYLPRTEGISSSEIRAEKRKTRISIIGTPSMSSKFKNELRFVNGVELVPIEDNFENTDAIYVTTMPQDHYHDVKKALLNGKHVLCESPISISRSETQELINLAQDNNLILADAIKTGYSTAFSRLIVLAQSGRIGEIVSVDATCTSLNGHVGEPNVDLRKHPNSISTWGPIAMLPVFQLLGPDYLQKRITTRLLNRDLKFDAFTKVDFRYDKAVASIKVARAAKSEGELIITGTKGYIYVPAPWWKTDYFEVRFENPADNKRYFYQLDGEGIRYEIVAFIKAVEKKRNDLEIGLDTSIAISGVLEDFYNGSYDEI
jgi:choline-phosphate cytidylyltransferase